MAFRSLGSGRSAGALVVGATLAVSVAVALGSGYTAAHAALSNESTYVAKGDAIAYVNGDSRTVDATTKPVAKPGDPVDVVTLPSGHAVAVNTRNNTATVIDGATMTPTSTVSGKAGKTTAQVVASGNTGWVVEPEDRTVVPIDGGTKGHQVTLSITPVDSAPGPAGSVIVLGSDGTLQRISAHGTTTLSLAKAPTGALTVAGGHTYLVTGSGQVIEVDGSSPTSVATIPGIGVGPNGRVLAGGLQSVGPDVLVVSDAILAIEDPATGGPSRQVQLHTGSDVLGRPVEYDGDAFVPDLTKHDVLRVDESTESIIQTLKVPGDASTFELFVSGGLLWANDQYAQHMLVVDKDKSHSLNKGTGDGVSDPSSHRPSSTKTTTKPPKPTIPAAPPPPPTIRTTPTGEGGASSSSGTGGSSTGGGTTGGGGGGRGSGGGHGGAGGGGNTTPAQIAVPTITPGINYQAACGTIVGAGLTCDPVAAGSQPGGATDSVIGTTPKAGTRVAPGSSVSVSYVGPVVVPSIAPGTTPKQACQSIDAADLQCDPQPAQVGTTGTFGTVSTTAPQSGASVSNNTKVTVYYVDTFTMPDESSKPGTQACSALEAMTIDLPNQTIGVHCTTQIGTQDGAAGDVYQQVPQANSLVTAGGGGATVMLTTYDGKINLPSYSTETNAQGQPPAGATVMQDCLSRGFSGCTLVTGDPPLTAPANASWAGDFESSDPGPGDYAPGTTVTITEYSGNGNAVPNVSANGTDQTDACTAITQAGYQCVQSDVTLPPADQVNDVLDQSVAAGTSAPLGTQITITYTTYQTTAYQQYVNPNSFTVKNGVTSTTQNTNDNVDTPTGQGPAGWGAGRLNFDAYAPGTVPGGVTIEQYSCGGTCLNNSDGLDEYGAPGALPSSMTTDGGAAFELLPATNGTCASGQVGIYNLSVLQSDGATKIYLYIEGEAGDTNPPLLGCAWSG